MPFYTEDEQEEFLEQADDGETTALGTELARKAAVNNVVQTLVNDIARPKLIIQTVDPLTMMPLTRNLVEGGIEYFNDNDEAGLDSPAAYSIDAILNGDGPIEEMIPATESVRTRPAARPRTHLSHDPLSATPPPVAPAPMPGAGLRELGLDFLQTPPTIPDHLVLIRCEGMVNFHVPFPCHRIVSTDSLVILVTDVRSTPTFQDMDFQVDRNSVRAALILPDQTRISIAAPVPRTISFEIGVLRCTLFVRDLTAQDSGTKAEG